MLFRMYSQKDNWISNAHPDYSISVASSGSNHGKSPSLNVFARKDDMSSGSLELARTLVQFDITELSGLIFNDKAIPSSSVSYYLCMKNMQHDTTVPSSYDIDVFPVSCSWDEGSGLDMDNHLDLGYSNWDYATSAVQWVATGSDFVTDFSASQHFDVGTEDLEVNVTQFVNEWLTGALGNYGVVLKLSDTDENNSINNYRKAFHGRESMFVDRLPYLEARWDSVRKDNRHNFALDLNNNLFLYNFSRGELTTLTAPVVVQVKDSLLPSSASYTQTFTAKEISTGIFTASLNISSTGSHSGTFYDIWTANGVVKATGTFKPGVLTGSVEDVVSSYTLNVNNLKCLYSTNEKARLKVTVRDKDFVTHRGIISTSSLQPDTRCVEKMYYGVINDETGETAIPFGTGSVAYTQLSYDKNGNYFDLWMNSFVPGFKYKLLFLVDADNEVQVFDAGFVFKVR
jgi:hypothetical protein